MSKDLQNNFSFWCPIEKATEKLVDPTTGEEIMRLGGIASTSDEDSDGEFLDPKGFDIRPLMKSGMVNWHHQAKGQPAAIIGEPSKAEIRKDGLYIETDLYPSSQIAHDVWELAKTLEKDSKSRRLGYSIEGKVLKRKSNNPSDPDYKHIVSAVITGVAITHMPKNPKTFANIIKGDIEDVEIEDNEESNEEEEKKGLNTENAAALKRESVDGCHKVLTKSQVFDKLFTDIAGISIEKAEQIYQLINNISTMAKKKNITEEDVIKAYEALGLEAPETLDIQKGEDAEDQDDEKDADVEKGEGNDAEKPEDDDSKEEPEDDDEDDEGDDDDDDEGYKKVKKGGENRFDMLEKAIADAHESNVKYLKALGVMLKDSANKLEKAEQSLINAQDEIKSLNDIVKAQADTIGELSGRIESFGAGGAVPKSISHARPVDRFTKGEQTDIEKGGEGSKVLSMSKNANAVAELLDQATFMKGYDEEFSKACTCFEAQHSLPASIIQRIKNEFGYEIVK